MRRRRRYRNLRGRVSGPGASLGRWAVVAVGLAIIATALVFAAAPYQTTQEFRQVVECDAGPGDCFDREAVTIVGRRTYTTTSTYTDGNGNTHTDTTTHYELTWTRAAGNREIRDVSAEFYEDVREGEPAGLRLWRGEVVGIEATAGSDWFAPGSSVRLRLWLYAAWLGLGVVLWSLLFGWWDGFFMLAFRSFAWMFVSFLPVVVVTYALAYGWVMDVGLIVELVFSVLMATVAGFMLVSSITDP